MMKNHKCEGENMKGLILVLVAGLFCGFSEASEIQLRGQVAIDAESIKVLVGTQTYHCETNGGLSCKAINAVQQKEIFIKKNGGKIQVVDEPRNLSADITTTMDNGEMNYDITLCSQSVCTQNSSNGGASGIIDLTMFGQFLLSEKSFYVLGFFISSQNRAAPLEEKFWTQTHSLRKN